MNRNRNHLSLGLKIVRYPLLALTYLFGVPVSWLVDRLGLENLLIKVLKRMLPINSGLLGNFKTYKPNKHDIVVCVYTKSGTNWAMHMAYQISQRGKGEFEHIHDVIPWPDEMIPGYTIDLFDDCAQKSSPTHLRVIKTHLEWEHIPYSDEAKYITIIRDPKDVFVSHYFFFKSIMFGPLMPPVQIWLDYFLSKDYFLGNWADHLSQSLKKRDCRNVLILMFKDMKEDLRGAVERMASFMEVSLTEEEIDAVCEKNTFEYMQSIDHKFYAGIVTPWSSRNGKMMRKGSTKGASELLSAKQQARINHYFKNELQRLNCNELQR